MNKGKARNNESTNLLGGRPFRWLALFKLPFDRPLLPLLYCIYYLWVTCDIPWLEKPTSEFYHTIGLIKQMGHSM
jgi:hypothetical protein